MAIADKHTMDQAAALKALALKTSGPGRDEDLAEAQKMCAEFLEKDPANPDFLYAMGMIVFQRGQNKAALPWMEKALIFAPESSEISYNYALMLMTEKKYAMALPVLRRVVGIKPDHAKAYFQIGNILKDAGKAPEALAAYDKALALKPDVLGVLNNKGNILKDCGRLDEAMACYQRVLDIKPDHHFVLNNMGVVYFLQGHLAESEVLHRRALEIQPDYPEAFSNLGMIARLEGRYDEAIDFCQKALALRADYPEALNNLGNVFKDCCRFEEAIDCYKKALVLRPDYGDVHNNLAMALLVIGRFEEGWAEQEWRWRTTQLAHAARHFDKPQWNGEKAEGETILVHAEQGFGDTLQFCRYAPMLAAQGLRVVMEVPLALKRLILTLDGVDQVVSRGDVIPNFAYHMPMMSLPYTFHTDFATMPAKVPYLTADPADVAKWAERVASVDQGKRKVGLVWSGNPRQYSPDLVATDRNRSMEPELLAPLMDLDNVQFFSLQKTGKAAPASFPLINWMEECGDFSDTAALIQALDLVITVDTSVVHLAGALGKPVWMLNRLNSCWRWFHGRDDSPWYPSLRLFHQVKAGDWAEVVTRIRHELAC